MSKERVMEIFMAIFFILIAIAVCVAALSGECDSDKPKKEKRSKIIVPIQIDKNTHLFIPL